MGAHMKTTVEISGPLLSQAKAAARRERTTLRALIEEGLRRVLEEGGDDQPFKLEDRSFDGGGGLTAEFLAAGGWEALSAAAYDEQNDS